MRGRLCARGYMVLRERNRNAVARSMFMLTWSLLVMNLKICIDGSGFKSCFLLSSVANHAERFACFEPIAISGRWLIGLLNLLYWHVK